MGMDSSKDLVRLKIIIIIVPLFKYLVISIHFDDKDVVVNLFLQQLLIASSFWSSLLSCQRHHFYYFV